MQLDFWQISRDPVERVVASIAARTRQAGERLLVVDGDADRRAGLGQAIWESDPQAFLANGDAAQAHAARQPILLSDGCDPRNDARYCVLADGEWRHEAEGFSRVFLLFGDAGIQAARATWRALDGRDGVTRSYYAQEDGKWAKKA